MIPPRSHILLKELSRQRTHETILDRVSEQFLKFILRLIIPFRKTDFLILYLATTALAWYGSMNPKAYLYPQDELNRV